MLVKAISFDIHDFKNHTDESFLVPDVGCNYEMIAGEKFVRAVHFVKIFDFQFEKEMRVPAFMIENLAAAYVEDYNAESELRPGYELDEMDQVDEMVGMF